MFRLLVSCLVLGAALAKPPPSPEDDDFDVSPLQLRDLLPLDPPHSEVTATYNLAAGKYNLVSPYYPRQYPNNLNQTFILQGQQGQVVSISCDFVSIEMQKYCDYDSLSIDGQKYCGSQPIRSVVGSPMLEVRFVTDGSVGKRGYFCVVTVPEDGGEEAK